MNTAHDRHTGSQRGFSMIEVLVATMITLIVMASVMMLLQKGQKSFQREPEVADMNQSARTGLDMISRDLTMAGLNTPPPIAIMWVQGAGDNPDQLTIVYADPDFPTVRPVCNAGATAADASTPGPIRLADFSDLLRLRSPSSPNLWRNPFAFHVSASFLPAFFQGPPDGSPGGGPPGGGGCGTLTTGAAIFADPGTFKPPQADPVSSFEDGQVLFAIEYKNCDATGTEDPGDGLGIVPFEVTPGTTMTGNPATLKLNHAPGGGDTDLNHPGGFNGQIHPDCGVIGVFRVIQYRINPLPPAANPNLERRDLSITGEGGQWFPVAMNVENLQVQFALGGASNFVDEPGIPNFDDPTTWITQVSVTVDATSQTQNLQGASEGVFADGNRLRRTFATTVSLRNQQNAMSTASFEAGGLGSADGYN